MLKAIIKIVLGLLVLAVIGAILAIPVMLLWNWVIPDIFNLPTIDFWHALGLSLLSCCLFSWGSVGNSKK